MAWTYVQGASGHTVTSNLSVPLSSNATAGHLIIATLCQFNTALQASSVFDTVGPSFTFGKGYSNPGGDNIDVELWYYIQPVTRALTVQVTSVNFIALCVDEFAPPAGTVSLAASAVAHGTSTTPAAGSFAAGAGNLVVAGAGWAAAAGTVTAGTGYTISEQIAFSSGANMGVAAEYKLAGLASENPGVTFGNSIAWGMPALSFTPGTGGVAPISVLLSDGCVPSPLRRHRLPRHILI